MSLPVHLSLTSKVQECWWQYHSRSKIQTPENRTKRCLMLFFCIFILIWEYKCLPQTFWRDVNLQPSLWQCHKSMQWVQNLQFIFIYTSLKLKLHMHYFQEAKCIFVLITVWFCAQHQTLWFNWVAPCKDAPVYLEQNSNRPGKTGLGTHKNAV